MCGSEACGPTERRRTAGFKGTCASEGTGARELERTARHKAQPGAPTQREGARRRPAAPRNSTFRPRAAERWVVLNQSLIASPTRGSDACATPLGPSVRLGVCGPAGKAVAAGSPATRSTLAAPGAEEAAQPVRIASHRSGLLAGCCGPCGIRRPSVEPPGGPGADQNDRAWANFRGGQKSRETPLLLSMIGIKASSAATASTATCSQSTTSKAGRCGQGTGRS